ncbi:cytochrome P450 [Cryphonectria parasitica EP155]|uniref:Cytochrome P450 n=1 Tax=Cryphonectria parasitica (strain ATCC 38755 / EP155) TaxID=660469 RepID=A0A9P4Y045_CRYP1|nr:cytochrome P450 [Cryphonectria parasitica EP155]KAF3763945.1 cytochrome P450 [Cryphonectria parasitica EP155]
MVPLLHLVTWQAVTVCVVGYCICITLYRLTFHPLSRFPGPKLAAITRWYEAYFDIVQNGQYTWKIEQLHKQYGDPYELHINDPSFFEQLYRHDGRWDKYEFTVNGWAAPGATIFTADHYVHKGRRQALNPYFSKTQVVNHQNHIRKQVIKLCERLSSFAKSGEIAYLGAAITAITRDIANYFVFGKHYNGLDYDDFDVATVTAGQNTGFSWRLSKHVTWFMPLLKSIPLNWIRRIADETAKKFIDNFQEAMDHTKDLMEEINSPNPDPNMPRTVIKDILESKLPPQEKTFKRVFEDVSSIAGAGFETTAGALRLILFHVFTNPETLGKLRGELTGAGVCSPSDFDLKSLEKLPYLTSTIMEGIRLSPAIASRMGRVAPDRDIFYEQWRIPARTPVGMTLILMHTDERLYPYPKRFHPERWMDAELRGKAEKAFAPFSRGTRLCLGMHLAWADMYMIVAALVQQFDFEFKDATAEDFECSSDEFAIGTRGKGRLNAVVSLRSTG